MEIRRASVDDSLDALVTQCRVPGVKPERALELAHGATERGECLIHVAGSGEIDGYAITSVGTFFGRDFIVLLAVAPASRRQGVASALLADAVRLAQSEVTFTSTNESNAAMQSLLRRDGWTFSGSLSGIDPGDPELVYWRRRDSAPASGTL